MAFTSSGAILLIDIPNSRGLVLGETRFPYLRACILRLFSTESACVAFDSYGVYVYKLFEDKAKKQHSLPIFQTLAVSCLIRRDLRTAYLPMFLENSRLSEMVN